MTARPLRRTDFELGPPELPPEIVIDTARRHFGVVGEPRRLAGERDLNLLFGRGAEARLLKVSSADELDVVVDLQIEALLHLEARAPELTVPRVVRTLDGATSARVEALGESHAVRMLTFVEGEPFDGDRTVDDDTLASVGRVVGRLAAALADFNHGGADHFLLWDISNGVLGEDSLWETLGPDVRDLAAGQRRRLVEETLPGLASQRSQVIHNDAHGGNVLRRPGSHEVSGVIDFGDTVRAPLINDLAICASGFIRNDALTAIEAVAALARGFHGVNPLVPSEIDLLYDAVLARLVLTMLLFDHQIERETGHARYCHQARPGALVDLADWLGHDRVAATERFFEGVAA